MPQVKFSSRGISALPAPGSGRVEYFDIGLPGFGLRVSAEGRRTWLVRYRVKGRKVKGSMTLGTFDADRFGLAEARDKAKDALRAAEKGIDPAEPVRKARRADTVKELAERFLEEYAKKRKRSWHTDERIIERDIVPEIGNLKASIVTRANIRQVLRTVMEREAPIMANRVLGLLRKIFNWAIAEEIGGVEHNPCALIGKPAQENRRDRVLSVEEIATLWKALDDPAVRLPKRIRIALKLQLVTAQRKGEVISAEWAEMDRQNERVWTIPAEKAKNKLAHRVPLSTVALELLGELKPLSGKSRWLFPSPKEDRPIVGRAVNHALTKALDHLGVSNITPHDLRRTAASHMTGMGISRLVVQKILNHVETSVTSVYDRHSYDPEKRQALDAWARRLGEITAGKVPASNVVELARA
ncbi:MAG TPA: tyrosine-type recombinase/integrase [Stellaceae bacterium]|nr:tyrosine-type recombinase/integrase [Stellaceae bacterium]